ncbi:MULTISPECIES: hypothetical protein [Sphingobacterium]|uniref:hypothetical protein n=1 Tax=Sphingobacterium TaxID=28453 RepID=UPI00257E580A|nr:MULTISPECIES: hypothetical protein [Sphingobacterium]
MIRDKKRVIVGMPTSFGFYKIINSRLEQLGFEVIDVSFQDHEFKYKNLADRLYNLFRKVFLGDRTYKAKLKFLAAGNGILTSLQNLKGKADYGLIIRSDIYPMFVMDLIRAKTEVLLGYQWDGLNRYPTIKDKLKYFDRFYFFDQGDIVTAKEGNNKVIPITNFFFSHLQNLETAIQKNTFLFLGSYISSRMRNIVNTEKLINDSGGFTRFMVYSDDSKLVKEDFPNIQFIQEQIEYIDYIKLVLTSEYLVDLLVDSHEGLSFRVFESIGYKKKLLTNNKTIRQYDFYHPNNVFILGDEQRLLEEFLILPYVEIRKDIIEKYDFDNWILRIFT